MTKGSGLGMRTVIRHILIAENAAWIKVNRKSRPFSDKRWRNNSYQAVIPSKLAKVVSQRHNLPQDYLKNRKGYATAAH